MKAFRLSPSNCSVYVEKTERAFSQRYYDKKRRWTSNGIDSSFATDPRYYYARPLTRLSGSGHGSNLGNATSTSLSFLVDVLNEMRIDTMIDAPCGDVNWQFGAWEVDTLRAYVGLDIVHNLIHLNEQRYRFHSNKVFGHWDVALCPLPRIQWLQEHEADPDGTRYKWEPPKPGTLVHMRDMLQHLRIGNGLRVMHHVMTYMTGAEPLWLLSTTFPLEKTQAGIKTKPGTIINRKIIDSNFFRIDLSQPPFSLPPPIRCVPTHPQLEPDLTCLYRLDQLVRDSWVRKYRSAPAQREVAVRSSSRAERPREAEEAR